MTRRSETWQLSWLLLVTAVYVASGFQTSINCTGSSISKHFNTIFNLAMLYKGITVAQIEENTKINVPNSGVSISNVSGTFSKDATYLTAIFDVECEQIGNIQCEIFGLQENREEYDKEIFKPTITFIGGVNNSSSLTSNTQANLSVHLFLTSILFVYFPFIIMPSIWCTCFICSKTWRNPEKTKYKYLRSMISLCVGLSFMIWWIILSSTHGNKVELSPYWTFVAMECLFIYSYATFKFLFKFSETSGWFDEQHAYNARVATSHGAVMTPIICWLMIRFSTCAAIIYTPAVLVIEIIFWLVAIFSWASFVFVSHRREGPDWSKQD